MQYAKVAALVGALSALVAAARGDDDKLTLGSIAIGTCSFSPDGKLLLTAARRIEAGRIAIVWDVESGRHLAILRGHKATIHGVRFSHNARHAVTCAGIDGDIPPIDTTARVWSLDPTTVRKIFEHQSPVSFATFNPGDTRFLTIEKRQFRVWDFDTGAQLFASRLRAEHGFRDTSIDVLMPASFSPDGRRVLGITRDQDGFRVTVWDAETGNELAKTGGQQRGIWSAVFSPSGDEILTASSDLIAKTWNSRTGAAVREFRGHTSYVENAVYQRDGRQIVTASADGTARLWDAQTGEELRRFVQAGALQYVLISSDTSRILTKWVRKTRGPEFAGSHHATLWDTATGREVKTFDLRQDSQIAILTPDGTRGFLTLEKTALVDLASGEVVQQFK